ncbi:MAG: ketoacyl-ACP synthase III [Planctomycetota bacterium]
MASKAQIEAVAYHLPDGVESNEQLAALFPQWDAAKIEAKTGIANRHVARTDECVSDLAVKAAERLFDRVGDAVREEIDFVLLCTQTPDYLLPTTACLVQDRLGLRTSVGALDINLGCSGYVYGLSLAKGLIETGQANRLLLLTADTYTKLLAPDDHTVRTLFGDGAAATLLRRADEAGDQVGPFVFGTDGSGADNLIARGTGLRKPDTEGSNHLTMSGADIFAFTLKAVPTAINQLLDNAGLTIDQVDRFVFHQANQYMLEHLRKKIGIPPEKFVLALRDCGNTVSSSIPIALSDALEAGTIRSGERILLVGFGVGYSWSAAIVRWP